MDVNAADEARQTPMDHAYIAEHGVIERYLEKRLPPDEEARFEEHFIGCGECAEQLELARAFARGVRTMTAEDALARQAAAVAPPLALAGIAAWLARRGRLARLGLAAGLLLLAAAPAAWLALHGRQLREAEAAARSWRQRFESERQSAAALGQRLAASERRRVEERRALESRLAAATAPQAFPGQGRSRGQQQAPGQAPAPGGRRPSPLLNVPLYLLGAVRGGPAEAPPEIDPGTTGEHLALAVDAGLDPRFTAYRVTVERAGGGTLLRQGGLVPNALEVVMITFPKSFFAPGDYRLRLEGERPGGGAADLGSFPFRVVARRR